MKIKLTHELVMAIGQDAANKRMRKAKRKEWNKADWNCACRTTKPLFKIMRKQEAKK